MDAEHGGKRTRVGRRFAAGVAVFLFAVGCILGWRSVFQNSGLNRNFDPESVAAAETRMWQAYYGGRKARLGYEMVRLLREQMGVSLWTAKEVIEPMARGAMRFAQGPCDYDREVLPDLITAYARMGEACGEDWDAREAARAELSWWAARRTPGANSPEQVGARIAGLYRIIYGRDNSEVNRAGLLRARAAALRDAGGQSPDWPAIESLLLESYQALRRGVE